MAAAGGSSGPTLFLGIGGGGDCAGAYAVAQSDWPARVGGVTWERRPVDPLPGPRRLDEIDGAEALVEGAVLAGPDTRGPGGFRFAESNLARAIGEPVLLVDPNGGPRAVASALDDAAVALGCESIVLVDVGGDVLAHGDEPGLASPLCDAVMLAATEHMITPTIGAVFGAGCDGELRPIEVLERIAEVGMLGAWGLTPAAADALEAVVTVVPTEASAMALRCARGGFGEVAIREGRRTVELSPVGAICFFYDCRAALRGPARLAAAIVDAESLDDADKILAALGIRTERQYEEDVARNHH